MFGLFTKEKPPMPITSTAPPKAAINRALAFNHAGATISCEPDNLGRPLLVISMAVSDDQFETLRQARLAAKQRLQDEVTDAVPASIRERAIWFRDQRNALADELKSIAEQVDQLEGATGEAIALRDESALGRIATDIVALESKKGALDHRAKSLEKAQKAFFDAEWPDVCESAFRATRGMANKVPPCGTISAEKLAEAIQDHIHEFLYSLGYSDGMRLAQSSVESCLLERRRELGG